MSIKKAQVIVSMSKVKTQHAEFTIEKMRKAAKAKSKAELARIIGIKPQSIHTAITRDKIPNNWFDVIKEKFGVTKDELCRPPTKVRSTLVQQSDDDSDAEERQHCIKEIELLFKLVLRWQEDINGLDSVTSRDFVNLFHERFPELSAWQKKHKGCRDTATPQKNVSDGTHG